MEIQYNGATITIKRSTVRTRLDCSAIYNHFDLDKMPTSEFNHLERYARFLTQCEIKGDIGFSVPLLSGSSEEIKAGLEAFLDADGSFYEEVIIALLSMDSDRNAPELLPEVPKKD